MMRSTSLHHQALRWGRGLLLGGYLAGAVVGVAAPAAAQSQEELDQARTLFRQGLSLEAAGNWAAALSKFQQVGQVKLTPQVRFHIGRCKEHLGRLNEALGDYRLAEYEAEQQELEELEAISGAREQLEARVPKLVITRGEGVESARIELDGVELGERQIGSPVAVDPGPHAILVRLTADLQFRQSVTIQERDTQYLELVPPPEVAAAAAQQPQAARTQSAPGDSAAAPTRSTPVVPWVVGGLGVASVGASVAFFVLAGNAKSDLEETCSGGVCPRSIEDTADKGQLYSTLAPITLGAGVAGIGVATFLLIRHGRKQETAADAAGLTFVDVATGPGRAGVRVHGRF